MKCIFFCMGPIFSRSNSAALPLSLPHSLFSSDQRDVWVVGTINTTGINLNLDLHPQHSDSCLPLVVSLFPYFSLSKVCFVYAIKHIEKQTPFCVH